MKLDTGINSNERGITIVSLVITIIVLIVLSSVLLMSFDEYEVINATEDSITTYKNDKEEVSNSVDEMVENLDTVGLLSTAKIEMIKEKIKTSELEDLEINYIPEYVKDRLGNPISITIPSTYNGGAANQTFTQEILGARGEHRIKWYIFSADDTGLNIISEMTLEDVAFQDSPGYDNCLYYLDQLSKKLFLNVPDFGVTESRVHAFRLSDIQKAAEWYNGSSYSWITRFEDGAPEKGDYYKTAVQSSYKYWPGVYSKYMSNGNMTILDGPECEKVGKVITDDTGIERNVTGNPATTLTVTGKYYDYDSDDENPRELLFNNLCINDNSEDGFGRTAIIQNELFKVSTEGCWLASRCFKGETTHTHFYLRRINKGLLDHSGLCYSSGYQQSTTAKDERFRVVVSIPPEHVDIDRDGNISLR